MLARGQRSGAFGEVADVGQDRHQVDVRIGEAVAGDIAAFGDGPVEQADFVVEHGDDGVDCLAVGLAVLGL